MSEKIEFALEGIEFSALPENAGDDDQPVLHRVQILKAGTKESGGVVPLRSKRKVKVTQEDILQVMAELQARGDALPMIRQHGKGPWGEEAIGWFRTFEATSKGIFGEVEWLPDAVPDIRSKKWRYTSPGMLGERDADGYLRPRVILEVSAVNTPDIDRMLPLAASAKSDVTLLTDRQAEVKERDMKLTETALKALGFKPTDTPTDEEVEAALIKIAALNEVVAPGAAPKPVAVIPTAPPAAAAPVVPPTMVSVPVPDGTVPVAVAASSLTPELLSSLTATIEANMEAKFEAREKAKAVKALVADGLAKGKLTAKSKDEFEKLATLDLSAATSMLDGMGVVAPVRGANRPISPNPIKVEFTASADREAKAAHATRIFQIAREKGISLEQAEKIASREAN